MWNRPNIEEDLTADFIVSSLLVPGGRTPNRLTHSLFREMWKGAADEEVVHDGVTKFRPLFPTRRPGPLTNVNLSYALEMCNKDVTAALLARLEYHEQASSPPTAGRLPSTCPTPVQQRDAVILPIHGESEVIAEIEI